MIKTLTEHIVKHLVTKPDVVSVSQRSHEQRQIIDIYVDTDDLKRVIGKEGRVVKSLRALLYAVQPDVSYELNVDTVRT